MTYFIKNMVCNRCIMAVRQLFGEEGFPPLSVSLGEVETKEKIPPERLDSLKKSLESYGFEMIDDSKSRIIGKIKSSIIQLIHHSDDHPRVNFSEYIASRIGRDYSYLSGLFSEVEGTTIEQYIIRQKIETVKELLVYDELSLLEIADRMGYSSAAYLSSQFKKVTGLTPGHFRSVKEKKRKPLDEV
jgi:AraC-like DNA-binding protein